MPVIAVIRPGVISAVNGMLLAVVFIIVPPPIPPFPCRGIVLSRRLGEHWYYSRIHLRVDQVLSLDLSLDRTSSVTVAKLAAQRVARNFQVRNWQRVVLPNLEF